MSTLILVVEDDPDIQRLLELNLGREGHRVRSFASGLQAWEALCGGLTPDLVMLDLMLPDLPGLELCRRLRADPRLGAVPVLMLTARADEIDRVVGFSVGADDYVSKPFMLRELLLRVRAILRRTQASQEPEAPLRLGDILLDPSTGRASLEGEALPLTPQEERILRALAQRRGRVCTREDLLDSAWSAEEDVSVAAVESSVKRLRRKLGSAAPLIETLRGVGYRMRDLGA